MSESSTVFRIYRQAGYLIKPALTLLLDQRTKRGKEDRTRRDERFGVASRKREPGPLVWVHAASVGETNAALPIIQAIADRGLQVLLTTGTVTSAKVAEEVLPDLAFHQYVPFDVAPSIRRFLDTWAPDLALFVESEIWPLTLAELGDRSVPVVIVNGRMSQRSATQWQRAKAFSRHVFGNIDLCLAQTEKDADLFSQLGVVSARALGNLKFDRDPLPVDTDTLAALKETIGERPVWIAASTHPGEEDLALQAHATLREKAKDALLILAPRHPQRGSEIEASAKAAEMTVAVRSRQESPGPETSVYLADTIGDMGLLYRVSDLAFVGGSFTDRGGQNPVEPAQLGVPVIHGPNVRNFKEIYGNLNNVGGALRCEAERDFSSAVAHLLFDPDRRAGLARNAETYVMGQRGALRRTLEALTPFLEPLSEPVRDRRHAM
ncbi:MAG: 3-deoxy-D-manno-octulosonic acid transferase [Pseudomonadota bacterium]